MQAATVKLARVNVIKSPKTHASAESKISVILLVQRLRYGRQ